MPKEFLTVLVSALPIIELRGAIPLAILKWGMAPGSAFALSVMGAFLPVIPILFLLDSVAKWFSHRSDSFNRFFCWFCKKTEAKNRKLFEKWASAAIFIVSAIPLPLFGAWSGVLTAFVFKIPIKKAAISIFFGTIVAGAIVLTLTLGGRLAVQ